MSGHPFIAAFLVAFVAFAIVTWAVVHAAVDEPAGCSTFFTISVAAAVLASVAVVAMAVGRAMAGVP